MPVDNNTASEDGGHAAMRPSTDLDRVEHIFQYARRLDSEERIAYLNQECSNDLTVRAEVESLLQLHEKDDSEFLSGSVLGERIDFAALAQCDEQVVPPLTRLGSYRIIRPIGEGGMGVVYLAEQETTKRRVALKIISGVAASPMLLRRFEHEAHVLGRLRHPGIAQVYEAGVHETVPGEPNGRMPFIAMELVNGKPIIEFANAQHLSLSQRLNLMVRVCRAVQHAHQHGVIHRDLKPANILVEAEDEIGRPRLVDFGIARATDIDVRATVAHTRTGQIIGTVQYMSPEQAAGDPAHVDTRADVYALGVVLYELICGRLPLDLEHCAIFEAVRIIQETDPTPLSSVDKRFRGDLTTIVGKALEKDRDRRYASAEELALELERHLRDEPILAHPPSAVYQLRKFAKRHRSLVVGSVAIGAVLVFATVVSLWQARAAAEAQRRAESHFADAHQLARTLLFEIDNSLVNVTGALPARRVLVERGLNYLDKIAQQEKLQSDPDLLLELAKAYILIGDVQGDTQRPNIGEFDAALESYRKAVSLFESMANSVVNAPQRSADTLFLALNKIGDQLSHRADYAGALAHFEKGLVIAEQSADRGQRATAHGRIADALRIVGRHDEANRHMLQVDALTLELISEHPERADFKRDLAVSHFKRGMATRNAEPERALQEFKAFVEISEELAERDPTNAVYQRDLAIGHQRMGFVLEQLGRLDEAMPLFERELSIMEGLAAADPTNYAARAEIASPCCKLGEVYLARSDFEAAQKYFDRYLEVAKTCAEQSPSNAAMQRELGVSYYKMNQWHAAQAIDESWGVQARIRNWGIARQWLKRSHDQFIMMREKGLLGPSDAGVPDDIAGEISACDAAIERLHTSNVVPLSVGD